MMKALERIVDAQRLDRALRRAPVVLLTGPRQVGKTTMARTAVDPALGPMHYYDAEDPRDLARLADPMLALEPLRGTIVIDEAQHLTELFPVLRVLADRPAAAARFLILGSASPDLVGLSAESLAGRVEMLELAGLRILDVGAERVDRLWERGGLPRSFLAGDPDADEPDIDHDASVVWRDNYIATFLERDLARIGGRVPATTMRRMWTMLAHYHGQLWNGAELSRALGVAQSTVRRYLDALTDALVVRQLPPWFANISKRQVRSPKIYVRDSGLLHRLLEIGTTTQLMRHPKVGASFEGFVIEQIAQVMHPSPLHHWRTQAGAELDLLVEHDGRRLGIEVKRSSAPTLTPSMRHACRDLQLDGLGVVHAGVDTYPMADRIVAVPVGALSGIATAPDLVGLLDAR